MSFTKTAAAAYNEITVAHGGELSRVSLPHVVLFVELVLLSAARMKNNEFLGGNDSSLLIMGTVMNRRLQSCIWKLIRPCIMTA